MKAQLEKIDLLGQNASFRFFKIESSHFPPFWHHHPELEITFIAKGNGIRFVGDHIGPFESNDLVLLGEHLPHQWVSNKNEEMERVSAFVFQFNKESFEIFPECKSIQDLLSRSNLGLYFPSPNIELIPIIKNFEKRSKIQQLSLLLQILEHLTKSTAEVLSSVSFKKVIKQNQSKISNITSYLLDNHSKNIQLTEMAQMGNMTVPAFCRWFKKSTGHTFVHYLQKIRIEKACQALITTDLQIAEIAYGVGFESISNFNRTFKRFKNKAPKEFRFSFLESQ